MPDLRLSRHRQPLGRFLLALVMLLLAAGAASAHPHVFIDYTATILDDGDKVTGVRIAWTFDEMYSASLFHDYTSRPQGPLGPADIEQLRTGAFQDTADLHFFTDIWLNGKLLDIKSVKDFDASYKDHRMTYRFTVPLDLARPKEGDALDFRVAAFDNEFYIDFELAKGEAIKVEHADRIKLACAEKKETRNTSVMGPVETKLVSCRFGKAA